MSKVRGHLTRDFARKMMPVAIIFGLLVCLTPPSLYFAREQQRLSTLTAFHASVLATVVADDAARHPALWRYRLYKKISESVAQQSLPGDFAVIVQGCQEGTVYFQRDTKKITSFLQRSAPVIVQRRQIARVVVRENARALYRGTIRVGLVSFFLGLGLGFLLYVFPVRVVRQLGREIEKTTEELEQAGEDLQRRVDRAVEDTRQLSSKLVVIQDEERTRIARDLHDGVGQVLTALRLELGNLPITLEEKKRIVALCEQTLRELKETIHDLRPLALEGKTLVEVMRDEAEHFEMRTGIATFFRHEGSEDPAQPSWAVALLRIFQEALTNVSKHTQAEEVGVTLKIKDTELVLRVLDDGQGFDVEDVRTRGGGDGLKNMETRARLFGADFHVESTPGEGTRVEVFKSLGKP